MDVQAGDVIRVAGAPGSHRHRLGHVLDVEGTRGHERLRVRWEDDHESMLFPGAHIEVLHHADPQYRMRPIRHAESWEPLWD